ncbi:putative lipid II flippase FtsW [bacterium]|nr:putative lipid II flippase FtsW [bacterium]
MNTLLRTHGFHTYEMDKQAGYDVALLLTTLLLCFCGAVFVLTSSAVHSWQIFEGNSHTIFWNHVIRLGLGLAVLITLTFVDYHVYEKLARPLVFFSILLLIAVFFLPQPSGATAKRWIYLAGFSFQPAEIAKFVLITYLAMRFAALREQPFYQNEAKALWGCMFVAALIMLMIVIEPNLSMALLISGIVCLLFFIAGAKLRGLVIPAIATLSCFTLVAALNSYMQKRISDFLAGIVDPFQSSYHVYQSLVGIGNGGFLGVGLGQSTQKHFFLPEPYNDFIFSIIGEELGILGASALLICFVLLLSRGWKIARNAPDAFGYFLAAGITISFALSFVINIGVTLGVLPATGQPLPFISYGGTSLMISLGAIGVLLNISRQAQSGKSIIHSFNSSDRLY